MRYFTPLLPPGEIFQSNSISKSWKVSSVNRSSSILGCGNDLIQPSSMVNPSPGGDFLAGSSQPANDVPSKSRRHPAPFSLAVSWLSAAKPAMTAAQASAVILKTRSIGSLYCWLRSLRLGGAPEYRSVRARAPGALPLWGEVSAIRRNPGTDSQFPAQFAGNWLSVQGLPHGKRYAWPCLPTTVKHPKPPIPGGKDLERSIMSNDRRAHPRNPCSCRPPHWRPVAARPVRPAANSHRFSPCRHGGHRLQPAILYHRRPLLEQRHRVQHHRCRCSPARTPYHDSRIHQAVVPAGDSLVGRRLQLHSPPDLDLQPRPPRRHELHR